MAQTVITGTRGTANIEQTKRIIDMSDRIAQLQPSAAPFTVLSMKMRKKPCSNPKFEWLN